MRPSPTSSIASRKTPAEFKLEKPSDTLEVHPRKSFGFRLIFGSMFGKYRDRSVLALMLMIAQAFLFNAVFFSYGLVLSRYHDVPETRTGLYLLPLAASNFLGPVLLGSLFDTIGRRKMIAGTYALGGVLLIATAVIFGLDGFSAWTQTLAWMLIFFFASAAASSAYLTASEIFPLETRALAIATFYAVGTAVGGSAAPSLFGFPDRDRLAVGARRRLSGCRRADAHRGADRGCLRRRRGGKIARTHCRTAIERMTA